MGRGGVGVGVGVGVGGASWTGTTVSVALSVGFGSITAPVTDQPIRWSPLVTPVSRAVTSTLSPGRSTPSSHWGESVAQV